MSQLQSFSATNKVQVSKLTIGTARKILIHGVLLSLLVATICAIVVMYVSSEHTIYYWDDAVYHDMTLERAIYFRDLAKNSLGQLRDALNSIRESTSNDYSDLHTLLIIPFVLSFGDARLVYILCLALMYLLPFILISGAIASKIIPYRPTVVFWSSAFLMLLIPAVWSPTLHGYPDTGSAALIGLAILLYLSDLQLKRWWRIILIGFCIALAILFRRHFIYDGITFFAAISLQALITFGIQLRQDIRAALKNLFGTGLRIALVAAATATTLAVLGWPFIDRILHTDFGLLYASYAVPFEESILYYISQYGWLACVISVIALIAALLKRSPASQQVGFVSLFLGISWIQWMISVRQLGFHYTLHFTLYIVLGIVACLWMAWANLGGWKRAVALIFLGLLLATNALVGLSPIAIPSDMLVVSDRLNLSLSGLFSANNKPLVRKDYKEVIRLVDYLRSVSSPADPIYVAASSGTINDDILWHAERTQYENVIDSQVDTFWENKGLNILHWVPFADSRDYYPLEKLLQSQYVVIATPFQYHLHPDEQKVVNVVVDAFEEDWELSQDFVRLPQQFALENQVVVTVYKRIRPTSLATTLHTLKAMQDYIGMQPGGQFSWIALSETPGYYITKNRDDTYDIAMDLEALKAPVTPFLYIDRLADRAVLTGTIDKSDPQCSDPALTLTAIDANGRKISSATFQGDATDTSDFSLSLTTYDSAHLLLDVAETHNAGQSSPSCWLSIHNLTITN